MEEFIENFNAFKEWLENLDAHTPEELEVINKMKTKFEELGLTDMF